MMGARESISTRQRGFESSIAQVSVLLSMGRPPNHLLQPTAMSPRLPIHRPRLAWLSRVVRHKPYEPELSRHEERCGPCVCSRPRYTFDRGGVRQGGREASRAIAARARGGGAQASAQSQDSRCRATANSSCTQTARREMMERMMRLGFMPNQRFEATATSLSVSIGNGDGTSVAVPHPRR